MVNQNSNKWLKPKKIDKPHKYIPRGGWEVMRLRFTSHEKFTAGGLQETEQWSLSSLASSTRSLFIESRTLGSSVNMKNSVKKEINVFTWKNALKKYIIWPSFGQNVL